MFFSWSTLGSDLVLQLYRQEKNHSLYICENELVMVEGEGQQYFSEKFNFIDEEVTRNLLP